MVRGCRESKVSRKRVEPAIRFLVVEGLNADEGPTDEGCTGGAALPLPICVLETHTSYGQNKTGSSDSSLSASFARAYGLGLPPTGLASAISRNEWVSVIPLSAQLRTLEESQFKRQKLGRKLNGSFERSRT